MSAVTSLPEHRTRYEVKDASGVLVATHVRIDRPDGDKVVYWTDPDGRKGLGGIELANVPLYGIERLGKAPLVVLTEGEKAAQALLDVDIQAVGTCTGASATPGRAPLADLNGRKVVLWPDADDVGFDHMKRIATRLRGIASAIYWIDVPDAQPHDDAVEALARFGADSVLEMVLNPGAIPDVGLKVERVGLGYRARTPVGRVELRLDRIKARSGQVHGELVVRSDDPTAPEGGHLLQHDFNVSSLTSRKTTAEWLAKRAPKIELDWHGAMEDFCRKVLALEREGLPIETLGDMPRAGAIPHLVFPMLPKDRATIIFGPGGSMKSYFAAVLALTVASGEEVLPGWKTDRPGKVLVLDWEADRQEWNERLLMIAEGADIDIAEAATRLRYRSCVVSFPDQVEELTKYVKDEGIALVIVDSVGMASPGAREGTDSNEGTLQLFRALRLLRVTALLVDHVSKDGAGKESGAKDPYGSIFKTNLARQTWEVRRDDPEGEGQTDVDVVLVNRKVNNGPRRDPLGVRLSFSEDRVTFSRTDLDQVSEALSSAIPAGIQIEQYLLRNGTSSKGDIGEGLPGVTDANLTKTLNRLVTRGKLRRDAQSRYSVVTHIGEDSGDF